jgi:hypothetical protein
MDLNTALGYINYPFPVCYRLIRRNDGNGNMVPVLQGAFLIANLSAPPLTAHEWRDLETIDDPTTADDHIPFFTPDEEQVNG